MKRIDIDSVTIKWFRSFAQPTQIRFSDRPGLKLVAGVNRLEPSLGGNGAGKSSIFDAIVWALYGQSIKGLRASDLIAYGRKVTEVGLVLIVDGEPHTVLRTAPPNRLFVDDEPAAQPELDRWLGLTKTRFLHSVLFGQGQPLFIDLPIAERGDLCDEILDLQLWLRAARRASERHARKSAELNKLQVEIGEIRGGLDNLPDLDEIGRQEAAWEADRDNRLRELLDAFDGIEKEIAELNAQAVEVDRAPVTVARAAFDEHRRFLEEGQRQAARVQAELNRVEKDIRWLTDHKECPTCGQEIAAAYAERHIAEWSRQRVALQDEYQNLADAVAQMTDRTNVREQAWQMEIQAIADIEREQAVLQEQIRSLNRQHHEIQQRAVRTRNEVNPYTEQKARITAQKERLTDRLTRKRSEELDRTTELAAIHYWRRQGFHECRLFCLENVLKELSLETRNSLLALGLVDWNIAFTTSTETKSETQRLGVQAQICRPPPHEARGHFNVLSGGEGQRARLAVSLGLANLVQRWAGVRWGIEVWDEPTAWLSEQGVEDLLETLAYRAETQNRSIYICDHRALYSGVFAEAMTVVKDQRGSHIEAEASERTV